jgi:hypothetical protein
MARLSYFCESCLKVKGEKARLRFPYHRIDVSERGEHSEF